MTVGMKFQNPFITKQMILRFCKTSTFTVKFCKTSTKVKFWIEVWQNFTAHHEVLLQNFTWIEVFVCPSSVCPRFYFPVGARGRSDHNGFKSYNHHAPKRRCVDVPVMAMSAGPSSVLGNPITVAAALQGRGQKKTQAQIGRQREQNRVLAPRTRLRKKFFFESLQKRKFWIFSAKMLLCKSLWRRNLREKKEANSYQNVMPRKNSHKLFWKPVANKLPTWTNKTSTWLEASSSLSTALSLLIQAFQTMQLFLLPIAVCLLLVTRKMMSLVAIADFCRAQSPIKIRWEPLARAHPTVRMSLLPWSITRQTVLPSGTSYLLQLYETPRTTHSTSLESLSRLTASDCQETTPWMTTMEKRFWCCRSYCGWNCGGCQRGSRCGSGSCLGCSRMKSFPLCANTETTTM
jgi:hypothetical protein